MGKYVSTLCQMLHLKFHHCTMETLIVSFSLSFKRLEITISQKDVNVILSVVFKWCQPSDTFQLSLFVVVVLCCCCLWFPRKVIASHASLCKSSFLSLLSFVVLYKHICKSLHVQSVQVSASLCKSISFTQPLKTGSFVLSSSLCK